MMIATQKILKAMDKGLQPSNNGKQSVHSPAIF